jgi:hypothetical protein
MLLSENFSPIFSNKSKSHDDDDHEEGRANNTPFDIIEHDVSGLSKISNLPPLASFDALQIGSER